MLRSLPHKSTSFGLILTQQFANHFTNPSENLNRINGDSCFYLQGPRFHCPTPHVLRSSGGPRDPVVPDKATLGAAKDLLVSPSLDHLLSRSLQLLAALASSTYLHLPASSMHHHRRKSGHGSANTSMTDVRKAVTASDLSSKHKPSRPAPLTRRHTPQVAQKLGKNPRDRERELEEERWFDEERDSFPTFWYVSLHTRLAFCFASISCSCSCSCLYGINGCPLSPKPQTSPWHPPPTPQTSPFLACHRHCTYPGRSPFWDFSCRPSL